MADDEDEVAGEAPIDPTYATAGPRRSTFTPPPASVRSPSGDGVHDDDALANALAEEFTRLGSGTINLPPEPPAPSSMLEPEPLDEAAFEAPQSAPEPSPDFEPPSPVFAAPEPEPSATPVAAFAEREPEAEPPPWVSAPAPDPAQAVSLEGPFEPPRRRSLPDEELLRWVDEAGREPGGTLSVIEQLETQLKLREEEAREFQAWESRMRSLGTPEAQQAVETVRPEFTGGLPSVPVPAGFPPPEPEAFVPPEVVGFPPVTDQETRPEPASDSDATIPPDTFVAPEHPLAAWPPPAFDAEQDAAEPEPPLTASDVESEDAAPEDVEPESAAPVDAEPEDAEPEDAEPEDAEPEDAEPEDAQPEDAAPEVAGPDAAEPDGTERAAEPEPSLPAWEIPDPSEDWTPPDDEEQPVPAEAAETDFDALFGVPAEEEPATRVYDLDAEVTDDDAPQFPFVFDAPPPVFVSTITSELAGEPDPQTVFAAGPIGEPDSSSQPEPEAVFEATIDPEPHDESTVETETEPGWAQAQDQDQDQDQDDAVDPDPAGPPPLVEPPPFRGPAILPSQAASMPPAAAPTAVDFGFGPSVPPPGPSTQDEQTVPQDDFIDPMPVAVGEPIPADTGTVLIAEQQLDRDLDDDIDETDRITGAVGVVSIGADGNAVLPEPVTISPPSGPISTVRIPEDEVVLLDNEPTRLPVFSIEQTGPEPTAVDHRVGRAARLFWLWFAANSSVLSLGLGAAVFAVGMSLRQSIVAILAGVALSFLPLGLTTLAGKRSGQPTMIVSRATFGVVGNVVPAGLAFLTRLFWGAVMLWLLGTAVAIVLVGAELQGPLGEGMLMLLSLGIAFVLALVVAFFGYPLLARMQLVLSIVSGLLVVGLIAMTAPYVDLGTALTTPDGPWLLTVSGAVLVFSFVGLAWANSGADLARYQRPGSSGAASMLWATFGATLPAFLLVAYGALLAASNEGVASGFLQSPLDTLAQMLPAWYPVPLLAAAGLSLLSGVTVALYSGGFALQAMGVRVPRRFGVLIAAALLGLLALVFTFAVPGGIFELFGDVATTVAVPTAAWAGIFAAETMIRNRRFESESLVRRGGVYEDVRWVNLGALVVISILGFALTTATVGWLSWQGYGFALLGLPLDGDLARTDLGVLVALVLGLLTPILFGIRAIRRQEATKL